jgi:hypothetical protein
MTSSERRSEFGVWIDTLRCPDPLLPITTTFESRKDATFHYGSDFITTNYNNKKINVGDIRKEETHRFLFFIAMDSCRLLQNTIAKEQILSVLAEDERNNFALGKVISFYSF